ncbi:acyltransferase [Jeotgalibacillus campisalis]|uniref:Acyltransferase 3 domain-containing protein n=1 Tax=Jeotgalibacillus campisalis TaxID=220754 RepID=A0A0C2VF08_9BACL|nr:acyltransferase [Jeotgalibacillus campisalis]KIL43101.1 hypothetical protein KR50_35040 [Jeotgalibacillus campisalis]
MGRNYTIDFIKFFAIYFVVTIHTAPFKYEDTVYEIINIFARFAVPFFFMTSGYFLGKSVQTKKDPSQYIGKSLLKNLKLYGSWVLFFFFYDLVLTILTASMTGERIQAAIMEYFDLFFTIGLVYYGPEANSFHLWFLIALVWSSLIVYFFVRLNKLLLLVIVSFGLNMVGLLGQSYHPLVEFPFFTRDTLFFGLFYTALGCFFAGQKLIFKQKPERWAWLVVIFSIAQIAEGLAVIHLLDSKVDNYYLSTVPLCISLFALAMTSNKVSENSLLARVGNRAVGIYVMHPLFISASLLVISALNMESIKQTVLWNIVFTPAILVVSYLSYEFIQKHKGKLFDQWKVLGNRRG